MMGASKVPNVRGPELAVARLLSRGALASVVLFGAAVLLMLSGSISPLDAAPGLDLERLPEDLVALRPSALAWLGTGLVLALPIGRLGASIVGFARRGEPRAAIVGAATVLVIAVGVVVGLAGRS